MGITNQGWENANESRHYPLDDLATGTDNAGQRMPDDILVDCQLRWPEIYGRYAYVGGITVTPKIVTILFMTAVSPDAAGDFLPLAAVTLVKPVRTAVHAITPLQPGVAGFVQFGPLVASGSYRFSHPRQSLLMSRAAQPYRTDGVTSLGKKGLATSLVGLVGLLAGGDVEIVADLVEIEGHLRRAFVVSLAQPIGSRNPLQIYAGPCGARPGSDTCDPPGIETINGVGPDCDGNIDILCQDLTCRMYSDCTGMTVAGPPVLTPFQPAPPHDDCNSSSLSLSSC